MDWVLLFSFVFGALLIWRFFSVESVTAQDTQSKTVKKPLITFAIDEKSIQSEDVASLKIAISKLLNTYQLILIFDVKNDEDEQEIKDRISCLVSADLPLHRILFSEKEEGRISIVRQLNPILHLDSSALVAQALDGKVKVQLEPLLSDRLLFLDSLTTNSH